MPNRLRSSQPWYRSLKKDTPRTSATIASRDGPPAPPPSSAILPIRVGGRLSTTKYPRSSRHLAASDRPAPDRPVITVKSTISWLWLRLGFRPVVVATFSPPFVPRRRRVRRRGAFRGSSGPWPAPVLGWPEAPRPRPSGGGPPNRTASATPACG